MKATLLRTEYKYEVEGASGPLARPHSTQRHGLMRLARFTVVEDGLSTGVHRDDIDVDLTLGMVLRFMLDQAKDDVLNHRVFSRSTSVLHNLEEDGKFAANQQFIEAFDPERRNNYRSAYRGF